MSKQSAESASLFLDNRYCYAKPRRADSVFRIDFPMVLGDMYRKYDKFKIVINNCCCYQPVGRTVDYSNHHIIKMTGLNFISSCSGGSPEGVGDNNNAGVSDIITGVSNGEATLQIIDMITGNANASFITQYGNDGDSVMFAKPGPSPIDVSFIFRDMRNNKTPPSFLNSNFTFTMSFTIYGLYD